MWVLVLLYAGAAITNIPGNYSTKEKCEEAAAVFEDASRALVPQFAVCIPAPDDIVYE